MPAFAWLADVLLEAAACGTPAVALRGTAAADLIIRYRSGLVVDDFNADVFGVLRDAARSSNFPLMRAGARAMAADHDISGGTATLVNAWLGAARIQDRVLCGVAT